MVADVVFNTLLCGRVQYNMANNPFSILVLSSNTVQTAKESFNLDFYMKLFVVVELIQLLLEYLSTRLLHR